MRALTLAVALSTSAAILSACGIKGPLYLPEPPAAAQAAAGNDHSKSEPASTERK